MANEPRSGHKHAGARPYGATRALATLCATLTLGATGSARADPFHSQTLPLGQRALGMGGAFTSIASDPSAVFYNPAGIAMTSDSALSASLTITAFDRSTVHGGFRTENGSSRLDHDTAASLPVFVSALKHLGRKDDEGRRRHGVALSTFTVNQRRLSFDVEVRRPGPDGSSLETLSIQSADRTTWHAVSYAYRATRKLAFGVSGILSVQRTRYAEERIGAELGLLNPDGSFGSDASRWVSHLVQANVKNLVARVGVLYVVNDKLRLGLMVQPPSVPLRGRATVRERWLRTQLDAQAPTSDLFNASRGGVRARGPIPLELRLGGSYLLRHWLLLSADASFYGRTGSRARPVVALAPRAADRETGAVPDAGAFFAERWYRTFNGNVSLGAEAMLRESIALRCGLYTDLSSAPPVPRVTSTYHAPDVHRAGGSFSIGLVNDGYDISLGAIGVFGTGRGLSYNTSVEPGGELYQRTRVTDRMFLVFLNGVRSAVRAIARKTEEKLRDMLKPNAPLEEPEARPEPRK